MGMAVANEVTFFLVGVAIVLIILNFLAHTFNRRKSVSVKVAFLPPPQGSLETGSQTISRFEAHIASTNQKLTQLQERMVAIENVLLRLQDYFSSHSKLSVNPPLNEIENNSIQISASSSYKKKK